MKENSKQDNIEISEELAKQKAFITVLCHIR